MVYFKGYDESCRRASSFSLGIAAGDCSTPRAGIFLFVDWCENYILDFKISAEVKIGAGVKGKK